MEIDAVLTRISSPTATPDRREVPAARQRWALPLPPLVKVAAVLRARWQLHRCSTVGALTQVSGRVFVQNGGAIHLGARVRLRGTHLPIELATLPGGTLTIGAGTFINSGSSICARERVEIGAGCAIGNDALILDCDFHDVDDLNQPGRHAPVILEDGVWLGARVTVLKGVTIGRGAVVAAGAVVTKDVPARTLVAGVPARVIRHLGPVAAAGASMASGTTEREGAAC